MTHTAPALAAVLNDLPPHHQAAVAFLARYDGNTHDMYARYLGQWLNWCEDNGIMPFEVTRGHVELYVRELGHRNYKPASIGAILSPVRGYYRWAYLDGLNSTDPAAYVRLPKVWPTKKQHIERTEMRRFLAAAKEFGPRHWALTQLLTVMGMRVSEACSLTVEQAMHVEDGMRVIRYIGKGSKPAATPVPYQSLPAIDAAIAGRTTGQLLTTRDGRPLSRSAASTLADTIARRSGIAVKGPHHLRAIAISSIKDAGGTIDEMQRFARHDDPRTTQRHYDLTVPNFASHPAHALGARLCV